MPASFNFPHTGKLLSLSFVLFAGWFADAALTAADYPRLASTGLLVLFGSMNVAIPFLLDLFHIPADTFQLFLATSVVNARFGTLMSAVHTLTVGVLGTCAVIGCVTCRSSSPGALRDRHDGRDRRDRRGHAGAALHGTGVTNPTRARSCAACSRCATAVRRRVYRSGEAVPPLPAVTTSVLARIRERGAMRVGYMADSLPYAFFNEQGALVGLDVEMAHQLARDSGVRAGAGARGPGGARDGPVVVDVRPGDVGRSGDGRSRACTCCTRRRTWTRRWRSSCSTGTGRRSRSWDTVRARTTLRVGVPDVPYYVAKIRAELPSATIVPIASARRHIQATHATARRHRASRPSGDRHTRCFTRSTPSSCRSPGRTRCRWRISIADHDEPLATVVNAWIDLKRKDGTIDELFAHWVLGREAGVRQPRWSLLDQLLSWRRGTPSVHSPSQ